MLSNYKNKKLLVLGANSFIGKNFLKKTKFHNIIATYYSKLPEKKFIGKRYNYKKIDLRNHSQVFNFLKKENFDIIINFIANNDNTIRNNESIKNIFDLNLFGFINIIESVRILKRKIIIYHFTSTEIDNNKRSLYSLSKYSSEKVQKLYNKIYNMNIHIIKLNNIFGPGDMNFLRLIPSICKNFCENKEFYFNANNKNKSLKLTYVFDLINFIEAMIKNPSINKSYKKIKYHKSTVSNIFKLLGKLNNTIVLDSDFSKYNKSDFADNLYCTLKWYHNFFNDYGLK